MAPCWGSTDSEGVGALSIEELFKKIEEIAGDESGAARYAGSYIDHDGEFHRLYWGGLD